MNAATITLSLVSHTNAGKTTLARTLLGRDVGEVRDRAHVTLAASEHTMLELDSGDALRLWDTPGFGDSVRLAQRLAQHGNPIGWFLSQVWDRFRDRPLWLAQQAVRNARDHADVVLYLVNASEDPAQVAYIEPELAVLEWIGKPVIALLNQTGPPRPPELETAEIARWRERLGTRALVRMLLPLDAFARCWVQEITFLHAVTVALPPEKRATAERLSDAWQERRYAQFRTALSVLAKPIARAACEQIVLPEEHRPGALRQVAKAIGVARDDDGMARALEAPSRRLAAELRASTDEVIRLYELEGAAGDEVLARLASDVTIEQPVNEAKAALLGGVVSGAVTGLAADLATGGLTLGAGMITGGLLGALGGAGAARGYNVVRGTTETRCRWSESFLEGLVLAALLRYLAIAHYGRGRGEWSASEHPSFWRATLARTLDERRSELAAVWARCEGENGGAVEAELDRFMQRACMDVLHELYPGALPR